MTGPRWGAFLLKDTAWDFGWRVGRGAGPEDDEEQDPRERMQAAMAWATLGWNLWIAGLLAAMDNPWFPAVFLQEYRR